MDSDGVQASLVDPGPLLAAAQPEPLSELQAAAAANVVANLVTTSGAHRLSWTLIAVVAEHPGWTSTPCASR